MEFIQNKEIRLSKKSDLFITRTTLARLCSSLLLNFSTQLYTNRHDRSGHNQI